ncbi:MAG: phage tail protein [Chloroflexales bacterium]|nr:phage tail protein [Chloroflexales bacterium]
MATAQRVDPYRNFRFLIEIDGIVQGGFAECSGFGSSVEVVEYREGGESATVRKLPGKASYPDLMLKWGVTDSNELYEWHRAAIKGEIQRRNGSIILLDDKGREKVRWNFYNAWPSKYDGPDFSATGNAVAIDSLTVSCESLERA